MLQAAQNGDRLVGGVKKESIPAVIDAGDIATAAMADDWQAGGHRLVNGAAERFPDLLVSAEKEAVEAARKFAAGSVLAGSSSTSLWPARAFDRQVPPRMRTWQPAASA